MASIECPICLNIYGNNDKDEKNPRILNCGHTFCEKCIKEMKSKGRKACPSCNQNTLNKNINEIPINRLIYDILKEKGFEEKNYQNLNKSYINTLIESYSIILLGKSSVGKTSIIQRFNHDVFNKKLINTIGIDFAKKEIKCGEQLIDLKIWDTAGQERYQSIVLSQMRGCHGAFLVFSFDENDSIVYAEKIYKNFIEFNPFKEKIAIVIGNKNDLKNENNNYMTNEGKKFAQKYSLDYFETSAFNGYNINKIFEVMGLKLSKAFGDKKSKITQEVKLTNKTKKKNKKNRNGWC